MQYTERKEAGRVASHHMHVSLVWMSLLLHLLVSLASIRVASHHLHVSLASTRVASHHLHVSLVSTRVASHHLHVSLASRLRQPVLDC